MDYLEILKWTWGVCVPLLALELWRRVKADIAAGSAKAESVRTEVLTAVRELDECLREHKQAYNVFLQNMPSAYASSARLERLELQTREDVRALHSKIEESAKEIRGSIAQSNREASERHDALVTLIRNQGYPR